MLNTIKSRFAPPVFEEDEEKTRIAGILNTVLLSIIVVMAGYIFLRPKFFWQNPNVLTANSALVLLLVGGLFTLRQGWVRAASLILIVMGWVNLTIQIWSFGGVRDGSFGAYIIVIVIAGLLLGWRAGVIFLILSILTGLGIAYAEAVGILPFAPDGPYALWFDQSLNFVLTTIMLTLAITSLNNALKRARHNEREMAKSNRELQIAHTSLEARAEELQREIAARKQAEEALRLARDELEIQVQKRTAELSQVIEALQTEIDERKQIEQTLRLTQLCVDRASVGIFWVGPDGKFQSVNDQACQSLGYTRAELCNMYVFDIDPNLPREKWAAHRQNIRARGNSTFETTHRRKDGTTFPIEITINYREFQGQEFAICFVRDISERKQAEEQIRASLKEKEVLLQEIHHRVKNNLQVIASLLNLQAGYVKNHHALEAFEDSQNRIRSMALIHEKLYRSADLAQINFAEYLQDLSSYLFYVHNANQRNIWLNLQTDDIFLGIDAAVPCGLIINELISNSLKHAFPDGQSGEVRIEGRQEGDNEITLVVSDSGIGFPSELDFRDTVSLGLQLVNSLVRQLDGTIDLERTPGTQFKISFTHS